MNNNNTGGWGLPDEGYAIISFSTADELHESIGLRVTMPNGRWGMLRYAFHKRGFLHIKPIGGAIALFHVCFAFVSYLFQICFI